MRSPIAAFFVVLLLAPVATAEPFTSREFNFSADFPIAPEQSAPQDSERDANGAVVSKVVAFNATVPSKYIAIVAVDSYIVPTAIDLQGTLAAERDSFLKEVNGTAATIAGDSFQGHSALRLRFDTPGHDIQGEGLVIVIEQEKPRIYVIVAAHGLQASSAEATSLDRFLRSFRLKQ